MLQKLISVGHIGRASVLSILSLAMLSGSSVSAATATEQTSVGAPIVQDCATYYVSKSGNNTDGKTWKTAFNELDQIKWQTISRSFVRKIRIEIDGGAQSMTYHKSLAVSVPVVYPPPPIAYSPPKSYEITRSRVIGHSGQIVIDGRNQINDGIRIDLPNTSVRGLTWRGIKVTGFRNVGIRVNAEPVSLSGIEIAGTPSAISPPVIPMGAGGTTIMPIVQKATFGLFATGYGSVRANGLIIHDTTHNVRFRGGVQGDLYKCWVYSSAYQRPEFLQNRIAGVVGGYRNEIVIDDPPVEPNGAAAASESIIANLQTNTTVRDSVIGPGLGRGVVSAANSQMRVSNCLLLNATRANLCQTDYTNGGFLPNLLSADHITSFMTPTDPFGTAHDAISSASPKYSYVNNSVVYGGHVRVAAGIKLGQNNTQFKTTGNTTALSAKQVNPHFQADVCQFGPNVTLHKLIATDFALSPSSPAKGTGSIVTSVRELLNSPLP